MNILDDGLKSEKILDAPSDFADLLTHDIPTDHTKANLPLVECDLRAEEDDPASDARFDECTPADHISSERLQPDDVLAEPSTLIFDQPDTGSEPEHIPAPSRKLRGHIDKATRTEIVGWVWDPANPNERIQLEITDGESVILTALADAHRPGLVNAGIGDGGHEFRIMLRAGLLSRDRHTIHLRCASTAVPVPGSPVTIVAEAYDNTEQSAPAKPPTAIEFGYCDRLTGQAVEGWAFDPSDPQVPLVMEVFIDNAYVSTIKCDRARYHADGRLAKPVGFIASIPPTLQDGAEHAIEFRDYEGKPIPLRDSNGVHLKWTLPSVEASRIGYATEHTDSLAVETTRFHKQALLTSEAALRTLREDLQSAVAISDKKYVEYNDLIERTIAEHLDVQFYIGTYPDIVKAQVDPVIHYCYEGWKEGRDPADWFDTSYYLESNPDIRMVGINPFYHYVTSGKSEGRVACRRNVFKREIIDNLVLPEDRTRDYVKPSTVSRLLFASLRRKVVEVCHRRAGLAVSFSHDCYIRTTGGIQIFLSDEQAGFAAQNIAYLNVSPLIPTLTLVEPSDESHFVELAADGVYLGITTYEDLGAVLAGLQWQVEAQRVFILNCFLGHTVGGLIKVQSGLGSQANYFWLHDYSSLCLGFNLLRNNVEFCRAPPPTSLTCRVCIYGEKRSRHLDMVSKLFDSIPFDVIAPSRAALAIWRAAAPFKYRSGRVIPHCKIVENSRRILLKATSDRGTRSNAVRVAFIGFPEIHKGWPIFAELVRRVRATGAYRMFHFCSADEPPRLYGVEHVKARTSAQARGAMIEALEANEVDLVLVLSPWPETFSYVTFEAMAAGCDVVTLANSGNVADAVLTNGRGLVAADEAALFNLFETFAAVAYVRLCYEAGLPTGSLETCGTTAAIVQHDQVCGANGTHGRPSAGSARDGAHFTPVLHALIADPNPLDIG